MHHYDPSWPHISQRFSEKEERKRKNGDTAWRRSSLLAGLPSRNHDIRVKHLVTQPGNAPKARPSQGLSEGLAFEDCKGRVLRRMQTLNRDPAYKSKLSVLRCPTPNIWCPFLFVLPLPIKHPESPSVVTLKEKSIGQLIDREEKKTLYPRSTRPVLLLPL